MFDYAANGGVLCPANLWDIIKVRFPKVPAAFDAQIESFKADLAAKKLPQGRTAALIW